MSEVFYEYSKYCKHVIFPNHSQAPSASTSPSAPVADTWKSPGRHPNPHHPSAVTSSSPLLPYPLPTPASIAFPTPASSTINSTPKPPPPQRPPRPQRRCQSSSSAHRRHPKTARSATPINGPPTNGRTICGPVRPGHRCRCSTPCT